MRARASACADYNIARPRESELHSRLHTHVYIACNITHYVAIVILLCVYKHLDPGYVSTEHAIVYILYGSVRRIIHTAWLYCRYRVSSR